MQLQFYPTVSAKSDVPTCSYRIWYFVSKKGAQETELPAFTARVGLTDVADDQPSTFLTGHQQTLRVLLSRRTKSFSKNYMDFQSKRPYKQSQDSEVSPDNTDSTPWVTVACYLNSNLADYNQ